MVLLQKTEQAIHAVSSILVVSVVCPPYGLCPSQAPACVGGGSTFQDLVHRNELEGPQAVVESRRDLTFTQHDEKRLRVHYSGQAFLSSI